MTCERRLRIRPWNLRPAVAGRRARHNAPVGQRHAPRINQVRAVSRQIAVDDQRVAQLDVALLPASARERAGPAAFARPFGDVALVVFDVDVEERMRVRPLDLRDRADEPHRLVAVELSGKRMVSSGARRGEQNTRGQHRGGSKFGVHAGENRWDATGRQGCPEAAICFDTEPGSSYDSSAEVILMTTTRRRLLATAF